MVTIGLLAFEEMFEFEKLWQFLGQRSNNDDNDDNLPFFMPKSSKLCMKSYVLAFSHI